MKRSDSEFCLIQTDVKNETGQINFYINIINYISFYLHINIWAEWFSSSTLLSLSQTSALFVFLFVLINNYNINNDNNTINNTI